MAGRSDITAPVSILTRQQCNTTRSRVILRERETWWKREVFLAKVHQLSATLPSGRIYWGAIAIAG